MRSRSNMDDLPDRSRIPGYRAQHDLVTRGHAQSRDNGVVKIGTLDVWPPVVLAPMAGITNIAFRTLCREQGGGLFVCEMITSRALVERNPLTFEMIKFGEGERPRSLQLYGVDPGI